MKPASSTGGAACRSSSQCRARRAAFILFVAAIAAAAVPCAGAKPDLYLLDPAGRRVDPFQGSQRATVFIFVRTDCPVSNRYAPVIRELKQRFTPKGAAFWLIYPNAKVTIAAILKHDRDFQFDCPALRDPRHELVKLTGAKITPEAVVFVPAGAHNDGRIVYRGRIDNQFVDFGIARPAATTHDLADALAAALAGKQVAVANTRAVGCYISDLP
jgi:AhpC/TSA family